VVEVENCPTIELSTEKIVSWGEKLVNCRLRWVVRPYEWQ